MKLHETKERIDARAADLSGSRFENVNLSGSDYRNINMSGSSFEDINMSGRPQALQGQSRGGDHRGLLL